MFTGIITSIGTVLERIHLGVDMRMCISPQNQSCFCDIVDGESIAINGVCLSVEKHATSDFWVYVSQQTLRVTNLMAISQGDKVNLERALRVGDRLGGHYVTGHVDGVGILESIVPCGKSQELVISYPNELAKELVQKGSVALDGISLTINTLTDSTFTVNIIPETQENTTVVTWFAGRHVHLETDILAKYVRRNLAGKTSQINEDFLRSYGFL